MQDACPATYEAAYHVAQRCPRTGRCNSVGGSFRNCGAGKTVVIDSCMSFKGCVYSQDGAELIGAFLESEGAFYCDASAHGIKAGSIPAGCFRGWDYPFEGFEDIACSQEAGTWPISKDPCTPSNHSDLAGVRIEFDPQPCAFTLAEAQAGISFSYRVIVDNDLPSVNVKTPNGNACFSVDASGLPTKATVTGAGQRYAIDDAGRCAAQSAVAVDLHKGTYTDVFVWTGRNWSGPSDTNNPLGPAFPAGDYTVDVTVNGADFVVWSRLTITLVP